MGKKLRAEFPGENNDSFSGKIFAVYLQYFTLLYKNIVYITTARLY